MRKLITFLMTCLVGSSLSYVNAQSSEINFEAGYRRDNLRFSLKVPSREPIAELSTRFKDIDIFQIGVNAKSYLGCNFYLRGAASWGWIIDGDLEEEAKINFFSFGPESDNTVSFTTEEKNILDGRYVVDFSIALGYPFYFCDCMASLSPVLGYYFDEQAICIERNDDFSFTTWNSFIFQDSGSGDCCCDKYISRWYGPFVGLDFEYNACGCWDIFAQVEYRWGNFKAKRHAHHAFEVAHEFDRTSHGSHGWFLKVGAEYDFCNCWTAGFNLSWTHMKVSEHHHWCFDDELFGTDISTSSFFSSSSGCWDRFKTSNSWQTFALMFAFGRCF